MYKRQVISEIHQKDLKKEEHYESNKSEVSTEEKDSKENFTDVDFDDI